MRMIIILTAALLNVSCLLLPINGYKEYDIIGEIENSDSIYYKGNKRYYSRSFISIKENKDTCILNEINILNYKTDKETIKYKEEKYEPQR